MRGQDTRIKIAVASGKGGTGKTTVATSLALSLAAGQNQGKFGPGQPLLLDCDVEAPNAHLFVAPVIETRREVGLLIPEVNEDLCSHCGKCSEVCAYHAIAVIGQKTLVFPELCHGCGSCTLNCPDHAISEKLQVLGVLEQGTARDGITFAQGILNVGQPMAVPIIRQLKQWTSQSPNPVVILDASPGTSCPVVEAIREADFLLLVTEPTPFGLHDLKLAVQVARELGIPTGVVINRAGADAANPRRYSKVEDFCDAENLPVLMRIPFERTIAQGIAQGKPLIDILPEYRAAFGKLFEAICEILAHPDRQRAAAEVHPFRKQSNEKTILSKGINS